MSTKTSRGPRPSTFQVIKIGEICRTNFSIRCPTTDIDATSLDIATVTTAWHSDAHNIGILQIQSGLYLPMVNKRYPGRDFRTPLEALQSAGEEIDILAMADSIRLHEAVESNKDYDNY